jgi:hypothetical protein
MLGRGRKSSERASTLQRERASTLQREQTSTAMLAGSTLAQAGNGRPALVRDECWLAVTASNRAASRGVGGGEGAVRSGRAAPAGNTSR